jgi:hypothetical protein
VLLAPHGFSSRLTFVSMHAAVSYTGLLLGFMAIICIQHPQVSPRLRMGIVIGAFMNMSGMLRSQSQSRRPQGSSLPGYD